MTAQCGLPRFRVPPVRAGFPPADDLAIHRRQLLPTNHRCTDACALPKKSAVLRNRPLLVDPASVSQPLPKHESLSQSTRDFSPPLDAFAPTRVPTLIDLTHWKKPFPTFSRLLTPLSPRRVPPTSSPIEVFRPFFSSSASHRPAFHRSTRSDRNRSEPRDSALPGTCPRGQKERSRPSR